MSQPRFGPLQAAQMQLERAAELEQRAHREPWRRDELLEQAQKAFELALRLEAIALRSEAAKRGGTGT